jgi:hypothetical protein
MKLLMISSQEAIDYCTKLYTSGQSINDHFLLDIQPCGRHHGVYLIGKPMATQPHQNNI